MIYGCNLPVDLVQSIHFINYSKSLRPGYEPPTVNKLSNDLLLDLHDHVEATAKCSNTDDKFSSKEKSALLKKHGGTEISLDEKSCRVFSLISTCNNNFKVISDILMKRLIKLDSETRELLLSDVFEETIKYYYDLMQPLLLILEKCEEPETLMADIVEEWLKLEEKNQYDFIKLQIENILSPIALISNLLHPIYRSQRFVENKNRMSEIMILLIDLIGQNGIEELSFYLNREKFFAKLDMTRICSYSSYWNTMMLSDSKSGIWSTAFNDICEKLLDISTEDLLKLDDYDRLLKDKIEKLKYSTFVLKFVVRKYNYNG
ncbi:hypothetical protein HCN44_010854 [Aphidius gifuensis]|uniref:Uncharacterized protein n=1 Tax=Aphidius gifuensis TaxID=684658 RepID=A0A835CNM3_APHGI|nr:hypothetical protein HCN44_010854 [Aphidius gifuensis]